MGHDRPLAQGGQAAGQGGASPDGAVGATIGGILKVNGFKDFLANYHATRAAADPMRESIGILAFHAGSEAEAQSTWRNSPCSRAWPRRCCLELIRGMRQPASGQSA